MKVIKNWLNCLFLLIVFVTNGFSQDNFAHKSVLSSGTWYKIKIQNSGIYKLTYEDIQSMGFSDPENIRIYGNGGRQLSYRITQYVPDDLNQVPLFIKSSDGSFGPGDFLLFYAEGIYGWSYDETKKRFTETINQYSLYNYYSLTTSLGPGKRIETRNYSFLSPNQTITAYDWHDYYEN